MNKYERTSSKYLLHKFHPMNILVYQSYVNAYSKSLLVLKISKSPIRNVKIWKAHLGAIIEYQG